MPAGPMTMGMLTNADRAVRSDRTAVVVAVICGSIFVIFGVGKFAKHATELASFRHYGLPLPEATVIFVGVVEILGGVLLLARRLVAPAAAVLAINLFVAIIVSGVREGEVIPSLTLAPMMLLGMLLLLIVSFRS